jgi:hypothetical protein
MAKKKEIEPNQEVPQPDAGGLLVMVKDGQEINVHPTQVGPWLAQGWTVKE